MSVIYKMCNECFEIFRVDSKDNLHYCVSNYCGEGELFDIDEAIAYTIQILNRKGYYTGYCCSGHMLQRASSTYIAFESLLPQNAIKSLPKGFRLEVSDVYDKYTFELVPDEQRHVIRYMYDGVETSNPLAKAYADNRANEALLLWALGLKNLNEGIDLNA